MPVKLTQDLSLLSPHDLQEMKIRFESEIDKITGQLESRREKKTLDPLWARRAVAAKKFYGRDIQRIQLELSRRKVDRTETFERRFIDAARRRLTDEAFDGIMSEARE